MSEIRYFSLLIVFFIVISNPWSTNALPTNFYTGAVLNVNKTFLENAIVDDLPKYLKNFTGFHLPSINKVIGPSMFPIKISFTEGYITNFDADIVNSHISINGTDANFDLKDLSLTIEGNLDIKFPLILEPKGALKFILKKTDFLLSFSYNFKPAGVEINLHDVDFELDYDLEISNATFSAKAVIFMANLFQGNIEEIVKLEVKNILIKLLSRDLNTLFNGEKIFQIGDQEIGLKYDLDTFSQDKDYLKIGLNAFTFYKSKVNPYKPGNYSFEFNDKNKIEGFISDFFLNSISYGLSQSGALKTIVTNDMIPKKNNIILNVFAFDPIFEGIKQKFTENHDIKLEVSLHDPLQFKFQNGNIEINASAIVSFIAIVSKSQEVEFATLRIPIFSSLNVKAKDNKVYLVINDASVFNITVIDSFVKNVNLHGLELTANTGIGLSLEAIQKRELDPGFNIPSNNIFTLDEFNLQTENGYIELSISPRFKFSYMEDLILETFEELSKESKQKKDLLRH